MRIVLKNAKFNVYGLADISELLSEVSSNYGGITDIAPVETLFRSLGADGSNNIWGKINRLYMPVLGVPGDGIKALYDIITKKNFPGTGYTIEAKRGVSPTSLGDSIGSLKLTDTILQENQSVFTIFTQSARQSLGNSSGVLSSFRGATISWQKAAIKIIGHNSTSKDLTNSTAFTRANYAVISKDEDGSRTFFAHEEQSAGALSVNMASSNEYLYLSGTSAWAATSLFALCDGLTSAEAAIVAAALDKFITDFGILCVN